MNSAARRRHGAVTRIIRSSRAAEALSTATIARRVAHLAAAVRRGAHGSWRSVRGHAQLLRMNSAARRRHGAVTRIIRSSRAAEARSTATVTCRSRPQPPAATRGR